MLDTLLQLRIHQQQASGNGWCCTQSFMAVATCCLGDCCIRVIANTLNLHIGYSIMARCTLNKILWIFFSIFKQLLVHLKLYEFFGGLHQFDTCVLGFNREQHQWLKLQQYLDMISNLLWNNCYKYTHLWQIAFDIFEVQMSPIFITGSTYYPNIVGYTPINDTEQFSLICVYIS